MCVAARAGAVSVSSDSACPARQAWNLTFLKKVIFLDADTLPVKPIDSLVEHPSSFAAAPDTFPADQFNSGVMVITPNASRYAELLEWNREQGTAEGGDQCLLNEYFSEWCRRAATRGHEPHAALPRGRTTLRGRAGFTTRGTTTTAAVCRG